MNPKPKALTILDGVTLLMFVVAVLLVFLYAPTEAVMGNVQRVFYFHVAAAWVGMLGFIAAAGSGAMYLIKKERKWDIFELAAVEVSLVFFFIAIVAGSIWARPAWGTWWKWEPRLTTATIVELVFAAYLMLRAGIEDPERRARFGAVYALLASLSVPLSFISIRILRTIHPVLFGGGGEGAEGSFTMAPKMLVAFLFSLLTFTFIFVDLFWHRIRLGRLHEKVEHLRLTLTG